MDYKNAKIYSIRNNITEDLYVGSTCQPLCKRWWSHKSALRRSDTQSLPLYTKMLELGKENFYIELLLNFPCNNKEELRAKEGEYIRKLATLNTNIAGRNRNSWRADFPEKGRVQAQQYRETYPERVKESQRKYREKYRDKLRTTNLERYHTQSKNCQCECGSTYTLCHKARHERTKKHQEYLKSIEQD